MNYVELNAAVSGAEQAEILTALLSDFPFEGFETDDRTLRAYIPEPKLSACRAEVDAMLNSYGVMRRSYTTIDACNWNAAWEQGFDPVEVDGRLRIRAPFHAPAPEGMDEVVIEPCMTFGTGHHATTYLMVSALLDLDVRARRGLDAGAGTGVLAITALKIGGAAWVDAVDTDARAVESTRRNAAANGLADRLRTLHGDVGVVAGGSYDFILANIQRNVLIADMPRYAGLLAPEGDLLLSGFLVADVPQVEAAAVAAGLHPVATRVRGDWALLHCRRAK